MSTVITMSKWVYDFGNGKADGNADMRSLLGGKGSNLAEMSALGIAVPPGFTITTELCAEFYKNNQQYPDGLKEQVNQAITIIEQALGRQFGDVDNPLLVSVRSGARASMPGMMDTVLNLGLNDETVNGLITKSNNPRFAYDSYRRFIQMYSDVVLGIEHYHFEDILELVKQDRGVDLDTELTAEDLKRIVENYKEKVVEQLGINFPQDVHEQLWGAITAVFKSWMNPRAKTYRSLHDIPEEWGTAVNIQAMVFGNMGDDCATGVAFTRDPSTGDNRFFGEYLVNAQGEDVVAGIRTPQQVTIVGKEQNQLELPAMEEVMPEVYQELVSIYRSLEKHYRDMQDIEFTVENKKLWILQTRSGKRTAKAALKIAVDMVEEGLITKEEAVLRIDPDALDQLLHPTLDPKAHRRVIDRGLPASPGAASGVIAFTSEEAEILSQQGERVILVRQQTSPEDINGMHVSDGILTARGGMTSHAAVVARGMGTPCVCGASGLDIKADKKQVLTNSATIESGDIVTINGTTGEVILGEVPTIQPQLSGDFAQIMQWADAVRLLKVRTNADTPKDVLTAKEFGAEGIGLCRTEHMFFESNRIVAVREMILASDTEGRKIALEKLLPMQKSDFKAIFEIMDGLPVTIRLLDPPLHEFLPYSKEEIAEVAKAANLDVELVASRIESLQEANPMLGHRGCRLGISYPEIYAMQTRAIFEAAIEVIKETGKSVLPEVMVPLVVTENELQLLRQLITEVADEVIKDSGIALSYLVGTMIELPRAALQAGNIAREADFFSFGTNDLTQTTFGISRDDAASFIAKYKEKKVIEHDPFVVLDEEGVGELITIAKNRGRKTRPDIKLGICGEHGGNPASVYFCHKNGLDYVSCSPYRVPIARLAAAQAALKSEGSQADTAAA